MADNIDLQAQAISAGLQRLRDLLDNPVATSALELDKSAATAREYDVLKRLHKSLLQYVQRDGTLFYVGVLGHFSAGKSSTINSLLNIWSSSRERATDLNPTDTTITLITKEENSSSLLGVIKEGHVTIRLEPVEAEFLDEIVLVDTPGTGDPQFIEEVARDFLPICDMILFVFSATSPFDKSDVPLLLELHKRLAFIPIHFVVTRADELRTNSDAPISEQNLDMHKTERFLAAVVARVNSLLAPQVYVPGSFSLIDNRTLFRVDQLRALLSAHCNSSNPQAHVSMHLNKLYYYRSGANSLKTFFAGVLEKKLTEISRIVEAAQRNIERFHQLVQISNSKLTQTWTEHATTIKVAATAALEPVQPLENIPQVYTGFRLAAVKRAELNTDLGRNAKYHAMSIASALKAEVNGMLQQHLYEVQKQIGATPLKDLSADLSAVITTPRLAELPLKEVYPPSTLHHRGQDLREAEAGALRDAAYVVRRSLSTIREELEKRAPLCSAPTCIEAAKESLKTDLNQFFQNVELYRSGVFSHATKESISTLGIGAKLDALETEFTDADKEEFTRTASADLFPGAEALIDAASARVLELSTQVVQAIEEAHTVRVERPEDNLDSISEVVNSERDRFASNLQAGLQGEIDRFCSGISIALANLIVQAKEKCDSDLRILRSARIKRYSVAFMVTALLFGLGSFFYRHSGGPAPHTILGETVMNLGCGLVVEAVVLGLLKIKENASKLLAKTRVQALVKLQDEVKHEIDNQMRSLTLNSLNEQVLTIGLGKIYERALDLPSAAWRAKATETLEAIRRIASKYSDLRKAYMEIARQTREDALQYFVDSTRNLTVLNYVASRIKEKAIQPSFNLLEKTRDELLSVKTQVEAIRLE
jgi:predicted GTPase